MGLVCVLWVGMTFMGVALLKCELFGGLFGAMCLLFVVGAWLFVSLVEEFLAYSYALEASSALWYWLGLCHVYCC